MKRPTKTTEYDALAQGELAARNLAERFAALKRIEKTDEPPFEWQPGPGAPLPDFDATAYSFIVAYGRSRIGKSFILEYFCEQALAGGLPILMADFDRDNASLTSRFPGATAGLANATDPYFERGLMQLHGMQVKEKLDVVLDIGFGSARPFRTFAATNRLQRIQEEKGVRPVLILPLSPNLDDLMPIELLSGVYMPRDVVLVINEGLVNADRDVMLEFEDVLKDRRILALIDRGARILYMPRMPNGVAFHNTKRPFSFAARADWNNPLNPFEQAGADVFLETAWNRCQALADIIPFPSGPRRVS